jgi:hypothetical protein
VPNRHLNVLISYHVSQLMTIGHVVFSATQEAISDLDAQSITLFNIASILHIKSDWAAAEALLARVVEIDEAIESPDLLRDRAALASVRTILSTDSRAR